MNRHRMSTKLWKEIDISMVTMVTTMLQNILICLLMQLFMSNFILRQLMLPLALTTPSILTHNII